MGHSLSGAHTTAILGSLGSLFMALMVIFIRLKSAKRPATTMKIIMPPIGMSTGFLMFLAPEMRIHWTWALVAFAAGVLIFSFPLIYTSSFHARDGKIYLQRSKAFVWILLILLAVRMLLHSYVEQWISIPQTGAVFFLLAFGMIVPWRIAMYIKFRRLREQLAN